jgi:hypothetical protein
LPQALTFSVARAVGWRVFQSRLLVADTSEELRAHATRARAVLPAGRLEPASLSTQNAFD